MYLTKAVCLLVMQGHLPLAGVNEDNLSCKEQKWTLNVHYFSGMGEVIQI